MSASSLLRTLCLLLLLLEQHGSSALLRSAAPIRRCRCNITPKTTERVPQPQWTRRNRPRGTSFDTVCLASSATDDTLPATIQQRLQDGMERMDVVMAPEFFTKSSSPILKSFYSKLVKNIEVRNSTIPGAGLGLFAKKAIKANTIVSFYPAHALGIDDAVPFVVAPCQSEGCSEDQNLRRQQHATFFAAHSSAHSAYLHCTDQPIFGRPSLLSGLSTDPLYLDVNPHVPLVDGWTSQMINDGATIRRDDEGTLPQSTEAAILNYYQQTKRTKNCIHIPFGPSPILATVTTKRVAAGDELLTTYGGTYWLGASDTATATDPVGNSDNVPVVITPAIQAEVKASAQDLFRSMQVVSVLYANQIQALQAEFDKIAIRDT